jgi:hypothetical protein
MQQKNPDWKAGSHSVTEVILELAWSLKIYFVFT